MTARGIPESPQFVTESEREVWSRLLEQGGDDWSVLANVRLTDEHKDHEADLVVLTDIFASGTTPIPGITGKLIVNVAVLATVSVPNLV